MWLISKRREDKTKRIVKKTMQGRGQTFVAEDRNTVKLDRWEGSQKHNTCDI